MEMKSSLQCCAANLHDRNRQETYRFAAHHFILQAILNFHSTFVVQQNCYPYEQVTSRGLNIGLPSTPQLDPGHYA